MIEQRGQHRRILHDVVGAAAAEPQEVAVQVLAGLLDVGHVLQRMRLGADVAHDDVSFDDDGGITLTGTFDPASLDKTLKRVFRHVRIHASGNGNMFFVATDAPDEFSVSTRFIDCSANTEYTGAVVCGEPVELVKCETNDLEVPANADFVIEGYVDPTEPLRDEGPFGDHTGYYTLPEPYPVFHVTAITHRKDAVYPATIVGIPPMEDFYIGGASVKLFLPIFKMNFPEIVDIALPAEGVFHNLVFVSIKKTYPMQAYKIMHGLWGMGQMMFTKYIIVVDDDVDVHNTSEVLFRLCANTDPQRDSIFTKGPSDVLDHATSEIASGSKLGIDATKKLPGEGFKRPWPPLIKMDAAVKAKVEKLFGTR